MTSNQPYRSGTTNRRVDPFAAFALAWPTLSADETDDALDHATGFTGGVYLVTLAQIETGFMSRSGYRGWSDPVCAGALQAGAA